MFYKMGWIWYNRIMGNTNTRENGMDDSNGTIKAAVEAIKKAYDAGNLTKAQYEQALKDFFATIGAAK